MGPATIGPAPAGVDHCLALLRYEGAGRELVARLKYRDARTSLRWLGSAMAELAGGHPVDVVTWAPTTRARQLDRGFDQAALLADVVARRLGVRSTRLLRRVAGEPQTGLSAAERRATPPLFAARRPCLPRVLLVDDILTTGGTLTSAAFALREGGAVTVVALVAARTPLKVGSGVVDA